jgi:hypothetical protein
MHYCKASVKRSGDLPCHCSRKRPTLSGTQSTTCSAVAGYHLKTPSALVVFHGFFDDKVETVRASTADAPAPTFSMIAASLSVFQPVSFIDVIDAIRRLPEKCCASDPVPTYLLMAAFSRRWFHNCSHSCWTALMTSPAACAATVFN